MLVHRIKQVAHVPPGRLLVRHNTDCLPPDVGSLYVIVGERLNPYLRAQLTYIHISNKLRSWANNGSGQDSSVKAMESRQGRRYDATKVDAWGYS